MGSRRWLVLSFAQLLFGLGTAMAETRTAAQDGGDRIPAPAWEVPGGAIWIEGRLVLPAETPEDERVEVIAYGAPFISGEVSVNWQESVHWHEDGPDAQGRFRIAFAADSKSGRIHLRSRYVHLAENLLVDLTRPDDLVLVEPRLGGCLAIQLLGPDGPLAEADLERGLHTFVSNPGESAADAFYRSYTTVDLGGGLFEAGGLSEDFGYSVKVTSLLFAEAKLENLKVVAGEVTHVTLRLDPGIRISGRVVDGEGNGVRGAAVRCGSITGGRKRYQMSPRVNDEGSFVVGGLQPGEIELTVDAPGFLRKSLNLGHLEQGTVRTGVALVLEKGNKLSGVVRWPDGTPAKDVTVTVLRAQLSHRPSMKTRENGRFEFRGLGGDPFTLQARAHMPGTLGGFREDLDPDDWFFGPGVGIVRAEVSGVPANAADLELVLTVGGAISGRIVDDMGEAVRHFRVRARPAGEERETVGDVFESEGGSFRLEGLPVGDWTVFAEADGHRSSEACALSMPGGAAGLELVLPRSAWIRGKVLTPAGEPVAGATVYAKPDDVVTPTVIYASSPSVAKADDTGVFELELRKPAGVDVYASAQGFGDSLAQRVSPGVGEVAEGLVLVLRQGGRISGILHPSVGEIAGREVSANPKSRDVSSLTTRADEQGRFELTGLTPDTYTLHLREGNRGVHYADVDVRDGETTRMAFGVAPETAIAVRGRVTRIGLPVADKLITCARWGSYGRGEARGRTDADGRYELFVEKPGPYGFSIGEDRWGMTVHFRETIPDDGGATIDFELPAAWIAGTVRGPDGGPEVDHRLILIPMVENEAGERVRGAPRRCETDGDGRYLLDALFPGDYVLMVGGNRDGGGSGSRTTSHGRVLIDDVRVGERDGIDDLDVDLPRGESIHCRVVDPGGAPAPGVRIVVRDLEGRNIAGWDMHRTERDGTCLYSGVASGVYTVQAEAGKVVSAAREVTVIAGTTTTVELVLDP